VIAALCLATDLGMGLPFEHGLHSTIFAMRLGERLGVDSETASQIYYGCLLFYVGCTADAEITAELFEDGALLTHFTPVMFGTRAETTAGIMRALAGSGSGPPMRVFRVASRLPRAVRGHQKHLSALCEVAQMLSDRLGLPPSVRGLFVHLTERWDGKGDPAGLKGEEIPLPLRVIHVARDAAFQRLLGGDDHAVRVVRGRAGGAFDPAIAARLAADAADIMSLDAEMSAWDETIACEPAPQLALRGEAIDQALAAMGDFADLASPYLVGHSSGVADLATAAGEAVRFLRRRAGGDAACSARPRRGARRYRSACLAEAGAADPRRVGTSQAASVSLGARSMPFTVSGRSRAGRDLTPRATRRLGIPPRNDGGCFDTACPAARRCRRLPRDDRAAAAP
jgi:hypothetical protein